MNSADNRHFDERQNEYVRVEMHVIGVLWDNRAVSPCKAIKKNDLRDALKAKYNYSTQKINDAIIRLRIEKIIEFVDIGLLHSYAVYINNGRRCHA